MITTKKFKLTPNQLFILTFKKTFFRPSWIFYALITALMFTPNMPNTPFHYCFVTFLITLPVLILSGLLANSYSSGNSNFFTERYYEFYDDKFILYLPEGSYDVMILATIKKSLETKDNYEIYWSNAHLHLIPKNIFQSKEDQEWFEEIFFLKIKK
jgi:hypothetical protein